MAPPCSLKPSPLAENCTTPLPFEDEVIDRRYVLNAERAREEERLGLGKKGKKQAKKQPKKAKPSDDGGQQSLL